jgi:Dimerisation domain
MNANSSPTPERLMQLAWSFAPPLIIETALQHGVFERLEQGARTAAQLAVETGASLRGLTAILNVLVGLELLGRDGDRYTLTPESSAFLVSSRPGYHGMFFQHISDQLLPRWLELNEIVRTGRPRASRHQEEEGAQFFAEFVEALFPISFSAASALGEHLCIREAVATSQRAGHRSRLRRVGHRAGETIATGSHPRRRLAARARGDKTGRCPARVGGPIDRRSGRVFRG